MTDVTEELIEEEVTAIIHCNLDEYEKCELLWEFDEDCRKVSQEVIRIIRKWNAYMPPEEDDSWIDHEIQSHLDERVINE
jgi:hypothetical protein